MNAASVEDAGADSGLRPGLIANYVAFAIVGLAGLGLNLVIVGTAGSEAVGLFSQTYVVFVILAQLATAGVHYAVLQTVSQRPRSEATAYLRTALTIVLPVSLVVAIAAVLLAPLLADAFDSPSFERALRIAAIGLPLHALNKVAIAYTNALESMYRFALYQAVRAIGLITVVWVLAVTSDVTSDLAAAFPISELVLAAVIVVTCPRPPRGTDATARWRPILGFGVRATAGGLVQEISARVDIIVLALLVSDTDVGVFTIAATAVEGCYQLLVVLRNNLNPMIAVSMASGKGRSVVSVARQLRRWLVPLAAAGWVLVVVVGRPALDALGGSDLERAYAPMVIMLGCLGLAAPLIPFDQILLVAGHPSAQSVLMVSLLAVNVVANLVLVPVLGINGAAFGTGLYLLCLAAGTWATVRWLTGVDLVAGQRW